MNFLFFSLRIPIFILGDNSPNFMANKIVAKMFLFVIAATESAGRKKRRRKALLILI